LAQILGQFVEKQYRSKGLTFWPTL